MKQWFINADYKLSEMHFSDVFILQIKIKIDDLFNFACFKF